MTKQERKMRGNKKAEAWSLLTASAHRSLSSFSSLNYTKLRTYRKQEKCSIKYGRRTTMLGMCSLSKNNFFLALKIR